MPSFQLHIARITPDMKPADIAKAVDHYADGQSRDPGREFTVLNCHAYPQSGLVQISLARQVGCQIQSIAALDKKKPDAFELVTRDVLRVTPLDMAINTKLGLLETYGGGTGSIENASMFLAGALALAVLAEAQKIDVIKAIDWLTANVERLQVRRSDISDYSHNSYMIGPYAPKFLDSQHGLDFTQEYIAGVKKVAVRFSGPAGHIGLNLTAAASFTGTVKDEDDLPHAQSICRKIAGIRA